MKLVIIDPGFAHSHAHHETVDTAIAQALGAYKADVLVLAAHNIDQQARENSETAGMTVLPYFFTPCYPQNAESLAEDTHAELSKQFSDELIGLYENGVLQGDETLLIHTGYSFHYAGLARALWHSGDRIIGQVLVCAMFNPGASLLPNTNNEIEYLDAREYLRHKMTFRLLENIAEKHKLDIQLATSCRAYQRVYQALWNADDVHIHPSVCYRPLSPLHAPEATGRHRVLLYLGGVKDSKGIEFAANLGSSAAGLFPDVEFIFHFNNDFPDAKRFSANIRNLQNAGNQHGNVQLVTGNIDTVTYDQLLQTSTVICVLYDPRHYKAKTSGVFWDALRCVGKSWLVTEQTWPEEELKEIGMSHVSVRYGDISGAVSALGKLLNSDNRAEVSSDMDTAYLSQLNSSFGDWLYKTCVDQSLPKLSEPRKKLRVNPTNGRGRILIVRTKYGHFSPLSGPGGFVPYLRDLGYIVDEKFVTLGNEELSGLPEDLKWEFTSLTQQYLNSYQSNAVLVENEIQRESHLYDVIHFVDGEHCGLLSALYQIYSNFSHSTRLIATYHQPASIMAEIVSNPNYLEGFDRIQLMSPCQASYFEQVLDPGKIIVVPHGLAEELLDDSRKRKSAISKTLKEIPGFKAATRHKKILLTVGNWLRDFDSLLQTAEKLNSHNDIMFVVVSKGLDLETQHQNNVLLINQGISDNQLHALYLQATLLFLPLKDGAANNAILEAMAHGLPIVATDIPATGYYTDGLATQSAANATAYADALEQTLTKLAQPGQHADLGNALKARARELKWEQVAKTMHEVLYEPLIEETR